MLDTDSTVVKPNAIELIDTTPQTKASEVGLLYKETNKVNEPIIPTSLLLDVPLSELKKLVTQSIILFIFLDLCKSSYITYLLCYYLSLF